MVSFWWTTDTVRRYRCRRSIGALLMDHGGRAHVSLPATGETSSIAINRLPALPRALSKNADFSNEHAPTLPPTKRTSFIWNKSWQMATARKRENDADCRILRNERQERRTFQNNRHKKRALSHTRTCTGRVETKEKILATPTRSFTRVLTHSHLDPHDT